jgi:hypothetical protein
MSTRGSMGGRGQAGQAMAEYAVVAAALMGGLAVMSFQILPDFIEALQVYLDGFYLMLNMPIP